MKGRDPSLNEDLNVVEGWGHRNTELGEESWWDGTFLECDSPVTPGRYLDPSQDSPSQTCWSGTRESEVLRLSSDS